MEIVKHIFTPKNIGNTMCSVVDGGYSSWIHHLHVPEEAEQAYRYWYADENFWATDYKIEVKYDLENDDEGNGKGLKIITPVEVKKGSQILADKYPQMWWRILNEESDALDADAWFQCVVLGDIVYG